MISITVRYTADEWVRIGMLATRLGIAKATLIHDATIVHVGSAETAELLAGAALDRLVRERYGGLLHLLIRRIRRLEGRRPRLVVAEAPRDDGDGSGDLADDVAGERRWRT